MKLTFQLQRCDLCEVTLILSRPRIFTLTPRPGSRFRILFTLNDPIRIQATVRIQVLFHNDLQMNANNFEKELIQRIQPGAIDRKQPQRITIINSETRSVALSSPNWIAFSRQNRIAFHTRIEPKVTYTSDSQLCIRPSLFKRK